MISVIICSVLAIACFIYSAFAFQQKGPLLSTMYFIANKEERKKMKTKKNYYFVATVFLGIAIIFSTITIGIILNLPWIHKLTLSLTFVLVVYVIVASFKSEIKKS